MRSGRHFFLGFMLGAISLALIGLFVVNWQTRMNYFANSLDVPQVEGGIQVLLEHQHPDQALQRLQWLSFFRFQRAKFNHCMSESAYHLWFSRARDRCLPILDQPMPSDWSVPSAKNWTVDAKGHLTKVPKDQR